MSLFKAEQWVRRRSGVFMGSLGLDPIALPGPPTAPSWQCEHCAKTFTEERSLVRHRKDKTCRDDIKGQKQRFPCPRCGKGFSRPAGVTRHLEQQQCRASSQIEVDHPPIDDPTAERPGSLTLMGVAPDLKRSKPMPFHQCANEDIILLDSTADMDGHEPTLIRQPDDLCIASASLEGDDVTDAGESNVPIPFHDAWWPIPFYDAGWREEDADPTLDLDLARHDGTDIISTLLSPTGRIQIATANVAPYMAPPQASVISSAAVLPTKQERLASVPEHDGDDFPDIAVSQVKAVTSVPMRDSADIVATLAGEKRRRRRTMRFSETSLEADMLRLSVSTHSSKASVGDLFGNAGRDSTGWSVRFSGPDSIKSKTTSLQSVKSLAMAPPMLSEMDEELELSRKAPGSTATIPIKTQAERTYQTTGSKSNTETWRDDFVSSIRQGDLKSVQRVTPRDLAFKDCRLDSCGSLPLVLATKLGHVEIVRWLLGPPLWIGRIVSENAADNQGRTALMYAAAASNLEMTKLLFHEHATDHTAVDCDGNTALMLAAGAKQDALAYPVVDYLLSHSSPWATRGPKFYLHPYLHRNRAGQCALDMAIRMGNSAVACRLVEPYARFAPMHEYLLRDNAGNTAFHVAAEHGNERVIRLLLKALPGHVNAYCRAGDTALMLAIKNGHMACVQELARDVSCDALVMSEELAADRSADSAAVVNELRGVAAHFNESHGRASDADPVNGDGDESDSLTDQDDSESGLEMVPGVDGNSAHGAWDLISSLNEESDLLTLIHSAALQSEGQTQQVKANLD